MQPECGLKASRMRPECDERFAAFALSTICVGVCLRLSLCLFLSASSMIQQSLDCIRLLPLQSMTTLHHRASAGHHARRQRAIVCCRCSLCVRAIIAHHHNHHRLSSIQSPSLFSLSPGCRLVWVGCRPSSVKASMRIRVRVPKIPGLCRGCMAPACHKWLHAFAPVAGPSRSSSSWGAGGR